MKKIILTIIICMVMAGGAVAETTIEMDVIKYDNPEMRMKHSFTARWNYSIFAISTGAQGVEIDGEATRMFPLGLHMVLEVGEGITCGTDVSVKYVSISNSDNEIFYVSKLFTKIPVTDAYIILGAGYQGNKIYEGFMGYIGVESKF